MLSVGRGFFLGGGCDEWVRGHIVERALGRGKDWDGGMLGLFWWCGLLVCCMARRNGVQWSGVEQWMVGVLGRAGDSFEVKGMAHGVK